VIRYNHGVAQVRFFENRARQRIAYCDEGDGPLVVMPAWWISHLERDTDEPAYVRFFARLTERLRVVRYDRVGSGLSDRERRAFTLESELDDVTALVEHLGATRFHLLAFSCAGPIALAYAARHPEHVDRMVFYGSYVHGEALSPPEVRQALIGLVRTDQHLGGRMLGDMFNPNGDAEARRRFHDILRASAEPDTAARLLELAYALDGRAFVRDLRAPVLVLHRKDDPTVRFDEGRRLCASIPGAALSTLAGGAHMPWHGDPDALADAIVGFLAGAPRRTPSASAELRREGEVWRLRFGERQSLLRDCKGLADLARLLDRPGDDIHVLDLVGADASERRDAARGDVTADPKALAEYRRRLRDLDEELGEAEANGDMGRTRKLGAEREALLAQLAADTGRRGRARRLADPVEKARKAVTARLRDAIRRVTAADRDAGAHLEQSIQTGVHCAYRPAQPLVWSVSPVSA
jgi:pimeloyl-ACP methyl ester carboxylesterase